MRVCVCACVLRICESLVSLLCVWVRKSSGHSHQPAAARAPVRSRTTSSDGDAVGRAVLASRRLSRAACACTRGQGVQTGVMPLLLLLVVLVLVLLLLLRLLRLLHRPCTELFKTDSAPWRVAPICPCLSAAH